jgi:hypothetical protein
MPKKYILMAIGKDLMLNKNVIELEHKISSSIRSDNGCYVHFDYTPLSSIRITVSATTYNPVSKETFLLKSFIGEGEMEIGVCDGLSKILKYVETHKKENHSFTIVWSKKREYPGSKTTSYFYCNDITDAIDKFFSGKEKEDYIIFEVKLNPIS